jgi:hypothetical protein
MLGKLGTERNSLIIFVSELGKVFTLNFQIRSN